MIQIVNPILVFIAIILTIMASFTAFDLLILLRSTERNRSFLFLGGVFSMTIGIWVMNFFGVIARDLDRFQSFNSPIIILSLVVGFSFTGVAFYIISSETTKFRHLVIGSLFMTFAALSIYIIGIYSINMAARYHIFILVISALMLFGTFLFSFWMLFYSKRLSYHTHIWMKPVSALLVTGAIVESHFLFVRASSFTSNSGVLPVSGANFMIYLVVCASILILIGLISSSTLISKRLATSDTNLKDITFALNTSSIVAITDPRGIITYVNEKFVEISQYTEHELLGQNHSILSSGYHSKEFFQEMWKTIGQGKVWRGEIRNKAKDGSFYWVDTTIVPFLNKKGKPYQYVSIRNDITDRKMTEKHLKATLKELSDIKFALDQSSIVAFTDAKGVITNVNDKFCEISGYSREELIGRTHSILNSRYHSKEFFQEMWKTIGQGKVWRGEIRNKAKDGSFYWVDTTIVPFVNDHGKPYQYLAIRNDITERKKTEEMLRRQDKLAAVGQMAAGIAHEIRNPLTSMKGYAEFLQLDETDEERKEYLDIILDEVDRVNSIVEDFLVLSKPKVVQLKEQNIVPVMTNILALLEFEARKKNVRLHFACEDEIIQVECDEDRLKQVFLNLIKNGIEAMPSGGDIFVRMEVKDRNVQISIQDTGVGIPEEKLKKIGEPFYTTKKNGNGLGLMVSFKIIESHNGKVYIESELNKGTTFNIILPAKTA
ncbi:MAG: PAS domain S-box protein [Ectobacillus sp.]